MKVAIVLILLVAMVMLPGETNASWFRRAINSAKRAVSKIGRKIIDAGKKVAGVAKKIAGRFNLGKRDVSGFDTDGDGQVTEEEVLLALASRDVEDLFSEGHIQESDMEDVRIYQRSVKDLIDAEE